MIRNMKINWSLLHVFALSLATLQPAAADDITIPPLPPGGNFVPDSKFRPRINLNGDWKWQMPDDQREGVLRIPGSLDVEAPVVYSRSFPWDSTLVGRDVFLYIMGTTGRTAVRLNQRLLGYTNHGEARRFALKDDQLSRTRTNLIELEVDNRRNYWNSIPLEHTPLFPTNVNGIFGEVFLATRPGLALTALEARTAASGTTEAWDISINVGVRARLDLSFEDVAPARSLRRRYPLRVEARLYGPEGQRPVREWRIALAGIDSTRSHEETIQESLDRVRLWRPGAPNLYRLVVSIMTGRDTLDMVEQRIGFREVSATRGDLLLNGERVQLRGINWILAFPGDSQAYDWELLAQDFEYMAEAGINCVRFPAQILHPHVLDLCDEHGILVLEGIPAAWVPNNVLRNNTYRLKAAEVLQYLIARDHGHPAVLAWQLGLGMAAGHPDTRNYVAELTSLARAMDTRPTYYTINPAKTYTVDESHNLIGLELPVLDHERLRKEQLVFSLGYPNMPKLVFALAHQPANLYAPHPDPAYVTSVVKMAYGLLAKSPFVSGTFPGTLSHWTTDLPLLQMGQTPEPGLLASGLIERNRAPVAYLAQLRSSGGGTVVRYLSDNRGEKLNAYPLYGLAVLLLFAVVYRRDRRFQTYLHRAFVHSHGLNVDIRDGRRTPRLLTFAITGMIVVALGTMIHALLLSLRHSFALSVLLTRIFPDPAWLRAVHKIILHPQWGIAVVTLLVLLVMGMMSVFFGLLGRLYGYRLRMRQTTPAIFWAATNLMLLVPVGMASGRLLVNRQMIQIVAGLLGFFLVWLSFRLVRALRVFLRTSAPKAWVLYIFLHALLFGLVGAYFYYSTNLLGFVQLLFPAAA